MSLIMSGLKPDVRILKNSHQTTKVVTHVTSVVDGLKSKKWNWITLYREVQLQNENTMILTFDPPIRTVTLSKAVSA
jgi:hypothetical protein